MIRPKSHNVPEVEWFQCIHCGSDLRSHNHKPDCELGQSQKEDEVTRVKCVISAFFATRGLHAKTTN
jgi:hypothetical protein